MTNVLIYLSIAVGSFLMGGVPFSWMLGRLAGVDLRAAGSGNPGATNLYRTAGPAWGIPALLLDMAKGAAAVFLAGVVFPGVVAAAVVAAAAAIAGHVWTPFLSFKGGKGVATTAGAFLVLNPLLVVMALASFVVVVAATRYVSLGSLTGAVVAFAASFGLPLATASPVDPYFSALCGVCAAVIIFAHRTNISRLLAGTEGKLWSGKRDGEKESG